MHSVKRWQSRRHAEKSFAFLAKQNVADARREAVAAYQLAPNEPQAVRAVARFLTRVRDPQALEFWRRLQQITPLTPEDLRDEAAIALVFGDANRAADAINVLTAAKNRGPADLLLNAQLAVLNGANAQARNILKQVIDDARSDDAQKFQATVMQLAIDQVSGSGVDSPAAWPRLEQLAERKDETGLNALVLLASRAMSSNDRGPSPLHLTSAQISEMLLQHPRAQVSQKLLALDLLEHENPARHDELINRAIADLGNADAQRLAALAGWLNAKGEYQRELDAIPLEKAMQNRDLFLQHLDALAGLGRWSEIKDLLNSDRFPLEPVMQLMYLARCNAQLGERTASDNNWQRAIEAARADSAKLMAVGNYAEKNGAFEIAKSAYDAAAVETPKSRVAQQARLRLAQAQRDSTEIRKVLAEMLRLWPNDTAVQSDEAYLRLLSLGQANTGANSAADLRQIEQLAQDLVRREPANLAHRTLLALARLHQNRPADALAVYQDLQISPDAFTPSARAVHAAVLAANNDTAGAKSEAEKIPPGALLPEERALIAGFAPSQ